MELIGALEILAAAPFVILAEDFRVRFDEPLRVARQHQIFAIGQGAAQAFKRLAAHHNDVAHRHFLEPFEILRQMPRNPVFRANNPVQRHRRNGFVVFHFNFTAGTPAHTTDPKYFKGNPVPQTSKSAVSRVSKPANATPFQRLADLEIGDTAGLETCGTPDFSAPAAATMKCPGLWPFLGQNSHRYRGFDGPVRVIIQQFKIICHGFLLVERNTSASLGLRAEKIDENRILRRKMCLAALITKHLRNFDFEIRVESINEPAVARLCAVSLIVNALRLINWPQTVVE
jgi:hypothetical protein